METGIQRWGNSLGVRIPKSFALEAGIEAGSAVDISVEDGELVIRPLRHKSYKLSQLVRRITPRNRHELIDSGPPTGREVW